MKSKILAIVSFLSFFLFSVNAFSQDTTKRGMELSVAMQIRPKFEFRSGYYKPIAVGVKPAAYTSQRNRVILNYKYKDELTIQVSPQNIFVWGQDALTQGATNQNGIGLFEAWARLKMGKYTHLQVGRQVISLDDERFFGELDWAQGGRSHDAAQLMFNNGVNLEMRLFAAYNQNYRELYNNSLSNGSGTLYSTKNAAPYKWMQTFWSKVNLNKNNYISLLANNLGIEHANNATDTVSTHYLETFGLNYCYNDKVQKAFASAYYQMGENLNSTKIHSYLLALSYSRVLSKKFQVVVGADLVSGNNVDTANNSVSNVFTPYFGTSHKFYGSMDYYYSGNGHKNAGLGDAYFKVQFTNAKKTNLAATFHQFITPNTIRNISGEMNQNLGQEIDLDFSYNISNFAKFYGGYSFYITTPTLLYLKGESKANITQHWAWIGILINPELFKMNY